MNKKFTPISLTIENDPKKLPYIGRYKPNEDEGEIIVLFAYISAGKTKLKLNGVLLKNTTNLDFSESNYSNYDFADLNLTNNDFVTIESIEIFDELV